MRWVGRLMTSVAAVLLTAGGASASSENAVTSVDAAWAAAARSDSLEAYAAFVIDHPDSAHARVAYSRLLGIELAPAADLATAANAPLVSGDRDTKSSPGISPGMIMII